MLVLVETMVQLVLFDSFRLHSFTFTHLFSRRYLGLEYRYSCLCPCIVLQGSCIIPFLLLLSHVLSFVNHVPFLSLFHSFILSLVPFFHFPTNSLSLFIQLEQGRTGQGRQPRQSIIPRSTGPSLQQTRRRRQVPLFFLQRQTPLHIPRQGRFHRSSLLGYLGPSRRHFSRWPAGTRRVPYCCIVPGRTGPPV